MNGVLSRPVFVVVTALLLRTDTASLAFSSSSSSSSSSRISSFIKSNSRASRKTALALAAVSRRRTITIDEENLFDPFHFQQHDQQSVYETTKLSASSCRTTTKSHENNVGNINNPLAAVGAAGLTSTVATASTANAAVAADVYSSGAFNPNNFQPVCPASDVLYRGLQGSAVSLVGDDKFVEYGPLIAGGLLRVRLELCVVESFFAEAVIPFIKKNGLSWILPLHETVETFLAGTVFALATAFILVGSSKILTVIIFYTDFFLGVPCRTLGGFAYDRATGKPVTLDIGFGPFKTRIIGPPDVVSDSPGAYSGNDFTLSNKPIGTIAAVAVFGTIKFFGAVLGVCREIFEALDLFVGRYLVIISTGYIAIKFLHFKVFPDFP